MGGGVGGCVCVCVAMFDCCIALRVVGIHFLSLLWMFQLTSSLLDKLIVVFFSPAMVRGGW